MFERKTLFLWLPLINQSMSYGGDCRTAPATPGLLNMKKQLEAICKTRAANLWIFINHEWLICGYL